MKNTFLQISLLNSADARMSVIWEMGLEACEWQGPSPVNSLSGIHHHSNLNKTKGGVCRAEEGKESRRHQKPRHMPFPLSCCVALDKKRRRQWKGREMVEGNLWTRVFFVLHILLPCKIPKMMLSAPSPYWDSSMVCGCILIVSSVSSLSI